VTSAVPWPWPGDTDIDKARRVAHDYRRELARLDPDMCARLDHAYHRLGQHWIAPARADLDLNAEHPPARLAEYLAGEVTANQISQWGTRSRIPRHTDRDGYTVYRVRDVLDYLAEQRRARAERHARHHGQ
jgi:DNA-binding GntR family transcriptional regulator